MAAPRIFVYPMFGRARNADGGARPGAVAEAAGRGRHQDSGHRSRHHGGDGGRGAQAGAAHRASRRGRRDQRLGRHQVRHHQHRALVRHSGRGHRERRAELSLELQLQQRDRPLPLRRPPVARGQPGAPRQGAGRHGAGARGVGCRRSISTRPAATCSARRISPGSPSTCIPRWRSISSRTPPTTARTSSAGLRPTRCTGKRTIACGWRRCASSTAAAA